MFMNPPPYMVAEVKRTTTLSSLCDQVFLFQRITRESCFVARNMLLQEQAFGVGDELVDNGRWLLFAVDRVQIATNKGLVFTD